MTERTGGALRVGVIGGSLAGCAMAVALGQVGCEVTVFERSGEGMRDRGSGIGLPRDLVTVLRDRGLLDADMPTEWIDRKLWIRAEAGHDERGVVAWTQTPFNVSGNNWNLVWDNLRRRVPDERYRAATEVVGIEPRADAVGIELADGERAEFDLLVAADGNRSSTRARFFPDAVEDYTGYVLWRGWYDGAEVRDEESIANLLSTVVFDHGHFNCWLVPAPTGSAPGSRQLAWILYDNLENAPFVDSTRGPDGTLRQVPQGGCTPEQVDYIHGVARAKLPTYYADLVLHDPRPLIFPLYDIRLSSYRHGRVVVAGDAGTTVTPMTGSGATKGLGDALALADAIAEEPSLEAALGRYDAERPPFGAGLANMGLRIGELLVENPPDWTTMDQAQIKAAWEGVLTETPYFYQAQD